MKKRYFDPSYNLTYTHFSDAFPPGGFFKEVAAVVKWCQETETNNVDLIILDARDCTSATLENTDRANTSRLSDKLAIQLTRSKMASTQIHVLIDPGTETGEVIAERLARILSIARQIPNIYSDIGKLTASAGLPDNYQMPRDSRRQIPID